MHHHHHHHLFVVSFYRRFRETTLNMTTHGFSALDGCAVHHIVFEWKFLSFMTYLKMSLIFLRQDCFQTKSESNTKTELETAI